MQLVCPHCTTSYAIKLETLGSAGRNVRCSRCKEIWLARPEDAVAVNAAAQAMAGGGEPSPGSDVAAEWEAMAQQEEAQEPPVVDSPSISADLPSEDDAPLHRHDWAAPAGEDAEDELAAPSRRPPWLPRRLRLPRVPRLGGRSTPGLPTACAAMGALALALIIWRAEIVHLLPQTALFYRTAGLEVNLRGLAFTDVTVTRETIEGKPALVIEGMIVGASRKPVELPRLRFAVRDAQGAEIYAWNTVLEQTALRPGERAAFKTRLASPPAEGRNIDIRFFNKRDLTGGRA